MIMKRLLVSGALLFTLGAAAQIPPSRAEVSKVYRATPERINDLVHTKLDARFDYSKSQLIGKAWITLKPHFYSTDSLLLDAKGMDVKQVALVKGGKNTPLKYTYDGQALNIDLDKKYKGGEEYTVYVDYIAKPDEFKGQGSAAITEAKGLYFINPRGEEKGKPTQIWTQGETEGTSVYVPTIDKPNQKTTQEFVLTVPAKYVTLSNGKLVNQKTNTDGTRTDQWKMDQPHAPYLFFIGVGEYSVVKDSYKGKEVSYYVEKEYEPVARRIFGNTPEMMKYFSTITGVDYPWVKYGQIVGRDYVSGAMENTTATLHQESAYQDARELADENRWEDVIAHELFHQWFGDYVTTESWSNLTLNESFANYSEHLWREYKYGKDAADAHSYSDMQGYLFSGSENKELVRFHYNSREDMFDAVSYNKGGRILHMLRNFVGDSAFFKAINLFLTTNRYKSAEAHQLRLAFEEITGKDLNWFFNQWYFSSGHPKLDIAYSYDATKKQAQVIVKQTQTGDKVYQLPVAIDVWNGANRTRHNVWVDSKVDTFAFATSTRPDLVNFDGDKVILAQKTENKSLDEYTHQYKHGNYVDRREAVDAAAKAQEDAKGVALLTAALNDKYQDLRGYTISKLDLRKQPIKTAAEPVLAKLAQSDPNRPVKAAAIGKLGEYANAKYLPLFKSALNDSSYSVAGNALEALGELDSVQALTEAKRLAAAPAKGKLGEAISQIMIRSGDESAAEIVLSNFEEMPLSQSKLDAMVSLVDFLGRVMSTETFKRGIDDVMAFVPELPENVRGQVAQYVEMLLANMKKAKLSSGLKEHADYIDAKMSKKGF